MNFSNHVLTNDGAALLRDAVNQSKKIVFTRAIAGSLYDMDSRGELASKPISWFDGSSGNIEAVSNALGRLQVSVSFEGGDTATPVKSVCICAQLAKDGVDPEYDTNDDIVFASCCDDNSGFTADISFAVLFDLPICLQNLVDDVGAMPNDSGLNVLSFTPGEDDADGVLQIKLSNGKVIDIAANEHSD